MWLVRACLNIYYLCTMKNTDSNILLSEYLKRLGYTLSECTVSSHTLKFKSDGSAHKCLYANFEVSETKDYWHSILYPLCIDLNFNFSFYCDDLLVRFEDDLDNGCKILRWAGQIIGEETRMLSGDYLPLSEIGEFLPVSADDPVVIIHHN